MPAELCLKETRMAANPLFNNDRLITATGKIDHQFIALSARARCEARYGADCRPAPQSLKPAW